MVHIRHEAYPTHLVVVATGTFDLESATVVAREAIEAAQEVAGEREVRRREPRALRARDEVAEHPLHLERAPMDLVDLVRKLAAEHQQAHTPIRVTTAHDSLVGAWDEGRLSRVLANVLDNAVKYSPAGGEIGVELEASLGPEDAWAVVRVRDQGLGIPAQDLPYVFERFYRGRGEDGRAGVGLGLALVRQIARQHGGEARCLPRQGGGTCFEVELRSRNFPC
jgi:signal transduction histidine kinase